eukprot:TRINITY_DN636_c0_g1_i1.p1 TRINITY_DN636_c0_g1~~TRINITY_DN636_c0_g1_i1.p1  ORF type:complete len:266 (+),score=49.08 TRINITY_DN636_c0_g1_i1:34-831(+)
MATIITTVPLSTTEKHVITARHTFGGWRFPETLSHAMRQEFDAEDYRKTIRHINSLLAKRMRPMNIIFTMIWLILVVAIIVAILLPVYTRGSFFFLIFVAWMLFVIIAIVGRKYGKKRARKAVEDIRDYLDEKNKNSENVRWLLEHWHINRWETLWIELHFRGQNGFTVVSNTQVAPIGYNQPIGNPQYPMGYVNQYPNQQYPQNPQYNQGYPNQQYPQNPQYNQQYPNQQFPNQQYPNQNPNMPPNYPQNDRIMSMPPPYPGPQ